MRSLAFDIRQIRWPIALIALGCLPFLWASLRHFDAMQWFGVVLLPFVLRTDRLQRGSGKYIWIAGFFTLLYLTLGQYYWTFAAALAIIYHLLDTRVGKLNAIAPYTIVFYLPLTRSFFTLFGFYIRVEITKWAGWLLSFFNDKVTYVDSSIWVDGNAFTVDAGCMGLRLVITGFILTLLMVQQLSKRKGITPNSRLVSVSLSLSFLMVIVANFFRILMIIQFRSPADSWSHEFIGLSSFLVFHLIPMFWMIKRLVNLVKPSRDLPRKAISIKRKDLVVLAVLLLSMGAKALFAPNHARFDGNEGLSKTLDGYELTVSRDGVHRYANEHSVLLVKPMHPLSFSNHHPMLCWRGDGFEVVGERKSTLGDNECYEAVLEKPGQRLTTRWWFAGSDGQTTINEWEWRWNALTRKQQYFLVNYAANSNEELILTAVRTDFGKVVFEP